MLFTKQIESYLWRTLHIFEARLQLNKIEKVKNSGSHVHEYPIKTGLGSIYFGVRENA